MSTEEGPLQRRFYGEQLRVIRSHEDFRQTRRVVPEERRDEQALKEALAFGAQVRARDEAARLRRQRLDDDIMTIEAERDRQADASMRAIMRELGFVR